MRKILISAACLSLIHSSHAQQACNACYDSVAVYDSVKTQTMQLGTRPDISVSGNNWNDTSVQCTAPAPDGTGHCISTCSNGTSNSYVGSCPAYTPPAPTPPANHSVQCTAPRYDGNGHCVATCSDGTVISSGIAQPYCAGEKP